MTSPINHNDQQKYAISLASRVGSFPQDPLHSAAYLKPLINYLEIPAHRKTRLAPVQELLPIRARVFLQRYKLDAANAEPSPPQSFAKATEFQETIRVEGKAAQNELVVMCGQPSPQWLNALGSEYQFDNDRFFFRHLEFLTDSQRDWFTSTILPSRARDILQLRIPSIVFIGAARRFIGRDAMASWRKLCHEHLRDQFKAIGLCRKVDLGRSIVRSIDLHSADCMVIEQKISISLAKRHDKWIMVAWSDAGDDGDLQFLPLHDNDKKLPVTYCPVFFERELRQHQRSMTPSDIGGPGVLPLAALAANYGRTLNWSTLGQSPLQLLEEFLTFQAAAAVQHLDMLHKHILEALAELNLSLPNPTDVDLFSTFNHAQSSLVRYGAHFQETLLWLRGALDSPVWLGNNNVNNMRHVVKSFEVIQEDLQFLVEKVNTLVTLCESGKSTLLNNTAINESRNSSEEARLVNSLAKITNRLTFIFLPISFVTSVFGMNFRQFGQGTLSITLWIAVTLPLLVFCVIAVETGPSLWHKLRALVRSVSLVS